MKSIYDLYDLNNEIRYISMRGLSYIIEFKDGYVGRINKSPKIEFIMRDYSKLMEARKSMQRANACSNCNLPPKLAELQEKFYEKYEKIIEIEYVGIKIIIKTDNSNATFDKRKMKEIVKYLENLVG